MSINNSNSNDEACTPLVSIVVLAYNHLDYTKQCIESLYKYTSHIDFELITINNGSTDGTEEFFQSLPNTKKINFAENIGVDKAINYGYRIADGKYTINVSNDLILTTNWLDNLLICMESDERIGMVAPVSSYSSNYQQVNLGYKDLDEMQEMAKAFNVSNPEKWEERLRLITYTCLIRTDLQKRLGGFDEAYNPGGFDDDDLCFKVRRMGYKLILAADTFVHHFGSVTFQVEYAKNDILVKNRKLFLERHGVDVWGACFVDFNILKLAELNKIGPIDILGIGLSCGATLLQLKNRIRAKGISDTRLWYASEGKNNLKDLQTICEGCVYCEGGNPAEFYRDQIFDYIIVESDSSKIKNYELFFGGLIKLLKPGGQMIFTVANPQIYLEIFRVLMPKNLSDIKSVNNYYFSFTK
jgi:GT2 family glycosyltransferase